MSKKGQALVEALAGLTVCILFFSCGLKLWVNTIKEIQYEKLKREKQICEMTFEKKCKEEAGFVLVTVLLQLSILIFAIQTLLSVMLVEEYRWKMTSWCFENGLNLARNQARSSPDELVKLDAEFNRQTAGLLQFKSAAEGPVSAYDPDKDLSDFFYHVNTTIKNEVHSIFSNTALLTEHLKCGAKKICHDQKCFYSLIVDRS